MKKIKRTEFGVQIEMFEELLPFFENACGCLYYGESKKQWFSQTSRHMSTADAHKIWSAAFEFMAEETQPSLILLEDIKLN